jgi:hypothetical protein
MSAEMSQREPTMPSLFEPMTDADRSGAIISDCGQYRYHLWRRWDETLPTMVWVMLNPSTADASKNDPTIRRCIGFAKREGCGGISVRNVFALRATDPRKLLDHPDPFGRHNEEHLLAARNVSLLTVLVLGWGARFNKRLNHYYNTAAVCLLPQKPYCFGVTERGEPRHPLYLKSDASLVPWKLPS